METINVIKCWKVAYFLYLVPFKWFKVNSNAACHLTIIEFPIANGWFLNFEVVAFRSSNINDRYFQVFSICWRWKMIHRKCWEQIREMSNAKYIQSAPATELIDSLIRFKLISAKSREINLCRKWLYAIIIIIFWYWWASRQSYAIFVCVWRKLIVFHFPDSFLLIFFLWYIDTDIAIFDGSQMGKSIFRDKIRHIWGIYWNSVLRNQKQVEKRT